MKVFKYFAFLMLLGCAPMALTSCGGDDDEPDKTVGVEDSNLPEGAEQFVGLWLNQGGRGYDFFFFQDGTATAYDRGTLYVESTGKWSFNKETSILATTIGGWQWQVTLVDDEDWAGIAFDSGVTQSFSKATTLDEIKAILESKHWESTDKSEREITTDEGFTSSIVNAGNKLVKYEIPISGDILTQENTNVNDGYHRYINIKSDINSFSFEYSIDAYNGWYVIDTSLLNKGTGKMTIKNPYNPKKTRLVCTGGPLEGEWKID